MLRTMVNSSPALLIVSALFHHICSASPLPSAQLLAHLSGDSIAEAATYLTKYGYVTSSVMAGTQRSSALTSLSESIREFQEFAALNVTGELDSATLAKMRLPRCGVKDRLGPSYRARRRKRYALQGSRWRTKDLRYKIISWPRSISDKQKVRDVIKTSFQVWQDKSSLTFKQVRPDQAAQIEIRFESGEHGDGDPFDGPGGTLAHAFFPLYGGDAHFDDDERWTTSVGSKGTNLFMTASHEFGHSLGLSHSKTPGALMGPFYQQPPLDGNTNVLNEDDVLGIQALYGPAENPVSSKPSAAATTPSTADEEDQQLCTDPAVRVDAMFMAGSQSQTYVFRGGQYWKLTKYGVAEGYPRRIADYWPGIPDDVDAAFSWMPKDRVYFFKGSKYWRMTNFKLDADYPKLISEGFQGIPNNVDACLRWTGNGKLYFFKGTEYWKYDSSRSVPVADTYPQPISNWRGIPENLDAALTYSNGFSYFFRKGYYYRFDDASFRVDGGEPPYPRPSGHWWFGCKSQASSMTSSLSDRDSNPPASSFNGDAVMGFGDVKTPQRKSSATVQVPATLLVAASISFLSRVIFQVFV